MVVKNKMSNLQIKKQLISNISPKQMISVFDSNLPIQARTIIEQHYFGLFIKTSGVIESIDLMPSYISLNFHDRDNILLACNFTKPVSVEVSLLNKGSKISLIGRVHNVAQGDVIQGLVALEECQLIKWENNIESHFNKINNIDEIVPKVKEVEEMIKLKPEFYGIGIDLKVLWKRIKKWLKI